MNKMFFFFVLVIVIIISIFFVIYFTYEKPVQDETSEMNFRNISIRVEYNGSQISTGLVVLLDESTVPYKILETMTNNFILVKIPTNRTFKIYNYNLENQTFYTSKYENRDLSTGPVRVDLIVNKNKNLTISHNGNLITEDRVFLNVVPDGQLEFVTYCVRWSENIISVNMIGVENRDAPNRLKNKVDRCFYTKQPINSATSILFTYKKFSGINSNDYIEVYILDGDIDYNIRNVDKGYIIEDSEFHDVGQLDYYYKIQSSV